MDLYFGHDIDIEQSQKLVLTPEMIQSLNILQFSRGELFDYVYGAMIENPVIDIDAPDEYSQQLLDPADVEDYNDWDEFGGDLDYGDDYDLLSEDTPFDWDADDWYNYAENMGYDNENYYGKYTYDAEKSDRYEFSSSSAMTLEENLLSQLDVCQAPYMTKAVAAYIIQTLDDNGYMTLPSEEIAAELGISIEEVQKGLELVWSLDPPGVGACSLAECLQLQLAAIDRLDDKLKLITENHLEDIAMNRLSAVAKSVGISIYEAQDYADLLKSLEPKPGRMFAAAESTRYVVPDVTVENVNGRFTVTLNSTSSPKVIIRSEYKDMLRDADRDSGVASFLSGRFNTAMWLIRAIEQRKRTITEVTEAIVEHQQDFLLHGKGHLSPLTMKEIAEELGVHESTVSRTVNGKYLQSPQGVYELRYFFTGTGRYVDANGESTSSDSLKLMIRRLVDAEDRSRPLSDRSIAEAIMVTGIEISRRTVAKYREEMGIPSSSMRRRVR